MAAVKKRIVPFFKSIQVKYALTYILVTCAVLILLNTYPVTAAQDLIFKSKQVSLQNQTAMVSSALSGLGGLTQEGVAQVMSQLDDMDLTRIMVTDQTGVILYDTVGRGNTLYQHTSVSEVSDALDGNAVFYSVYVNEQFRSRAAAPVVSKNMTIGAVFLYEEDSEQASLLQGLQVTLLTLSGIIVVLLLLVSLLSSRALAKRFSVLLRAIGIVREGNYGHRIHLKGSDEMALLAGEFDQLTKRLQTTEEVRRRFVSDASHELKTPLASICLLSDSILQNEKIDMETTREFVADIGEEAKRLTRISERLLTLTRLDAEHKVERAPVEIGEVVGRVRHMLEPLARENTITLMCECEEPCVVLANVDDLYQVIFNLMENAIKYNRTDGTVMVKTLREENFVVLTVEDTGVGIPEEDQDKVFNRFYRVDKARSRAAGGTGLGLSIVRSMVRQHEGSVSVRNREPEGTCFTVRFPALRREGG